MGRPAKFDREQALDVVMNAIWKHGYEHCSVKSMSELLGITRSSFYNAFGSREALFEMALGRYFEQSPNRVLASVGENDEIIPVIIAMLQEICHTRAVDPENRGCMAVNCTTELVGTHPALGWLMADGIEENVDRFEELLAMAVKNGELDPSTDIRETALALQNLILGVSVMSKVFTSEADLWSSLRPALMGMGLINPDQYLSMARPEKIQ